VPLQLPVIDLMRCLGCGTCVEACPEDGVLQLVHGQAAVVAANRCVGHARCEQECPVSAITVGIVDAEQRRDVPALTAELEATTVPLLFLAGEVTARSLIRTATLQGAAVADTVARRLHGSAGPEDAVDLLIVGAGPAGLACALEARRRGLSMLLIDREQDVGGAVARYPRRKLVMTEPFELPLLGRLRRQEYEKEELVALWQDAAARHELPFRGGETLLGIERDEDGSFRIATDAGEHRARAVCLCVGRRGVPRRLGVPGEQLPKVAHQLYDASSYSGRRVLVVGGGDSAVETALALAEQDGNEVVLAHRRSAFDRIRTRNEERLRAAVAGRRIALLLDSEVAAIGPASVELRQRAPGGVRELSLANDDVFVQIGGELPFALLEQCGVSFDPAHRAPVEQAVERGPGLLHALAFALLATAAALGFVAWHRGYYLMAPDERAADPEHAVLGPGARIGLGLGIAAVAAVGLNLLYLLRRNLRWFRFGSLRAWMTAHVATGFVALLAASLHSGFVPQSSPGGWALWALGGLLLTGAIGRWFYAWVPRAANGRELELAAVKERVASLGTGAVDGHDEFLAEARAAVLAQVERRQWGGTLPGRIVALCGVQFDLLRLLSRLRAAGRRRGLPEAGLAAILALAGEAYRAALSVAHFEDLRALLGGWRWLHRWLSLLLVLLLAVHVVQALTGGTLVALGGAG
jgi:thioredoxin reductase